MKLKRWIPSITILMISFKQKTINHIQSDKLSFCCSTLRIYKIKGGAPWNIHTPFSLGEVLTQHVILLFCYNQSYFAKLLSKKQYSHRFMIINGRKWHLTEFKPQQSTANCERKLKCMLHKQYHILNMLFLNQHSTSYI